MPQTFLFVLAIIPVIGLMLLIYFSDKIEREPVWLVLSLLGLGIASTIPAMIWEVIGAIGLSLFLPEDHFIYIFIENFFIVAVAEETCKFLFMLMITWKNKHFDYAYDGVVYATSVSLGFALLENIMYVLSSTFELGPWEGFLPGVGIGISRALLAVPLHTAVAIFMGFFYGKAKEATFQNNKGKCALFIVLALAVPMLIHGFYDFCLSLGNILMMIVFFAFVVFMYVFTIIMCIRFAKQDHNITGKLKVKVTKDGWLRYAITDQREIMILGLTKPFQGQILVIPEVIENFPVRIIARSAFAYTNIVRVQLPQNIRLIEDTAFFNCPYLSEVILPNQITGIGNFAFEYCYNLRQFMIPHLRFLGNHVFDGCNQLTEIYYLGSQEEWKTIQISMPDNNKLMNVSFYYNAVRK